MKTTLLAGGAVLLLLSPVPAQSASAPRATSTATSLAPDDRPWMGLFLETTDDGVRVDETIDEGPAARAGLRAGDRVVSVGDAAVSTVDEIASVLAGRSPGERIALVLERGGERVEVAFELGRRDAPRVATGSATSTGSAKTGGVKTGTAARAAGEGPRVVAAPPLGSSASGMAQDARSAAADDGAWLGVSAAAADERGVEVTEVRPGSPAARAGVRPGDVVVRAGATYVDSVEELGGYLSEKSPGDTVTLRIRRGDEDERLRVELGSKPATDAAQERGAEPAPRAASPTSPTIRVSPGGGRTDSRAADDRPWIGVALDGSDAGLVVSDVFAGSPAARAGLRTGDRIESVAGSSVASFADLETALSAQAAGDTVRVRLARGGETKTLELTLGRRPDDAGRESLPDAFEDVVDEPLIQLEELLADDRGYMGVYLAGSERGVRIDDVVSGGPADRAGLRAGDVLVRLGGRRVATEAEVHEALAPLVPGDEVAGVVERENERVEFRLELAPRPPVMAQPAPPADGDEGGRPTDEPPSARPTPDGRGGYLGVYPDTDGDGVFVQGVLAGSPAERAGLRVGDRILAIGVDAIHTYDDLVATLAQSRPGERVTLRVRRDGEVERVRVQLGSAPEPSELEPVEPIESSEPGEPAPEPFRPRAAGGAYVGVTLESNDDGVAIASVLDDTPAARAGLEAGDRIVRVGDTDVESVADLGRALARRSPGERVVVVVERGDGTRRVEVTLGSLPGAQPPAAPRREGAPAVPQEPATPGRPQAAPATPGWLGVSLGLTDGGVVLAEVLEGSPAERAGLQAGDRVLAVNDQPVESVQAVVGAIRAERPGRRVSLRIERDGAEQRVRAVLGNQPEELAPPPPPGATPQGAPRGGDALQRLERIEQRLMERLERLEQRLRSLEEQLDRPGGSDERQSRVERAPQSERMADALVQDVAEALASLESGDVRARGAARVRMVGPDGEVLIDESFEDWRELLEDTGARDLAFEPWPSEQEVQELVERIEERAGAAGDLGSRLGTLRETLRELDRRLERFERAAEDR